MITPDQLIDGLAARGYRRFAGVPCSYLGDTITALERRDRYVAAPHEGIALSLVAGYELAGVPSGVLLQNSGLGNLLNPLASLVLPYQIPVLLVVSMRGWPAADDESHHAVTGRSTTGVLDALGVDHVLLDESCTDPSDALDRAVALRKQRRPLAILTTRKTFAPGSDGAVVGTSGNGSGSVLSPAALIGQLVQRLPDAFIVSTTGLISRELYRSSDSARRFYMQGSMGHAISIGLGRALSDPDELVVVLDGDGAALMHLGASALVGSVRPRNLVHMVLDNGGYASTGGQSTPAGATDWIALGKAMGYRLCVAADTEQQVAVALESAATDRGPLLIVSRVGSHAPDLPRISESWSDPQVFARARSDSRAAARTTIREESTAT